MNPWHSHSSRQAAYLKQFRVLPSSLELFWEDGQRQKISWFWLRDHDPASRLPSGQKLSTLQAWPEELLPKEVRQEGSRLEVTWLDDGHISRFETSMLRASLEQPGAFGSKVLWNRILDTNMAFFPFGAVNSGGSHRLEWIEWLRDHGFVGLRGVPAQAEALEEVIRWLGPIRETNFGRIFDIRAKLNPSNLSDSNLMLPPRTENPYRDPAPGLHAMLCLDPGSEGGAITLVDGFFVLQKVKRRMPQGFQLLSEIPVRFHYEDDKVWLTHERTLVEMGFSGEVRSLAFNNRSVDPFSLPGSQQEAWYHAYRKLEEEILAKENQLKIPLGKGDLLLIDNRRVLHGQEGYPANSQRLLLGCYTEQDGLMSAWRKLRERKS